MDTDAIHIVDWTPGPALEAYIDENGEPPCDVFLDCEFATVIVNFIGESFDVDVYGGDLLSFTCQVVAQEDGDSEVTVTNQPESDTALVTYEGGTAIDPIPECNTFDPFPFPMPVAPDFTLNDTTASVGGTWEMIVDVEADDTLLFLDLTVTVDDTQLDITDIVHGAGLDAYIEDNGDLALELVITGSDPVTGGGNGLPVGTGTIDVDGGDAAAVLILFNEPFDTALYGTDVLRVQGDVVADEAVEAEVSVLDLFTGNTDVTGTVSVTASSSSDLLFLRGDTDADGDCDMLDAVATLRGLFIDPLDIRCEKGADYDDNGTVGLTDALSLLTGLFIESEPLEEECGTDGTDDSLTCEETGC